jgi:hypothetical protein
MSGLRRVAVLVVLCVLVSSVFVLGVPVSGVEGEAVSAVEGAEAAVAEAFGAVWEAEGAGGNVSGLLDRLDVAADYLATARMCLRAGDSEGAVGNASLCVEALEGLVDDAVVLRASVVAESGQRFWMAISGSVVGVVAVVCGSFFGWRWFKKRYYARALTMKPEVAEE